MTPAMRDVVDRLKGKRFSLSNEKQCQNEIEEVFKADRWLSYEREVRISGGVIDFVVGFGEAAGLEIKLKGAPADIRRQLVRYAAEPRVAGLVLVTAKPVGLPALLRGKPVHEFDLSRAWL